MTPECNSRIFSSNENRNEAVVSKRPRVTSSSSTSFSTSSSDSSDTKDHPTLHLDVDGVGNVEVAMDPTNAPRTVGILALLANSGCGKGQVHRAEAVPAGDGPPYALVQATLDDRKGMMKKLRHEGSKGIDRGSVCLIVGTSDVFVSLASHPGWERSMTVFGEVDEKQLGETVEPILQKAIHQVTQPKHGTVMAMLDRRLAVRFGVEGVHQGLTSAMSLVADPGKADWEVHFSEGRPYYFNRSTKISQWKRPT